MNESRRSLPISLPEKLSDGGSSCPIPFTHDRLQEAHHWWHEMAYYYHEPEPFRYRLGAYIQAARSVTFMLQSEKAAFSDFGWYDAWVESAKTDPVLRWLNAARTELFHQQALEPTSWMEMRCIGNPRIDEDDEDFHPLQFRLNPFACTHYYIRSGGGPWSEDHPHEYERHWELDSLPGRELLEATADAYDRLDDLVVEAHRRLGAQITSFRRADSPRALPCMESGELLKHRIVRTTMKDGHDVWVDEPPGLHKH